MLRAVKLRANRTPRSCPFAMKIDRLDGSPLQSKLFSLRFDGRTLLLTLFLAFIALLVFTPLLFLLYGSIEMARPDGTTVYSFQGWRQALANPGIAGAIYN